MEVEIKLQANSRRTLKPSKREKNNMASKPFEEKQIVKEIDKEKELKHEKQEKTEKSEKLEKEHKDQKDQKDNPDTKQHKDAKDQKDTPDTKHKQEKEHKPENKEALLEKVHKDSEVPSAPFAAAVTVGGAHKLTDKSMIADK